MIWWILLAGAALFALLVLERRQRLRPQRESDLTHVVRNLAVAATAGVVMAGLEDPAVAWALAWNEGHAYGILTQLVPSGWLRVALGFLLLDYSLYLWHVLTHKVPWLWRFHLVHHIDLDLDASTALRFHFGEMLLSVPWRVATVLLLGLDPVSLQIWRPFLIASIVFHHSNLRLPLALERVLAWFIMTPRLHWVHHHALRQDTDSNWSSGLSWWDRLHGTYRWKDQAGVVGVPAYQGPESLGVGECLKLPFGEQRKDWERGAAGGS